MSTLVTWRPAYRVGEPDISELLDEGAVLAGAVRVELENGSRRWIPADWIEEVG
jgi:hypothetical protein